MDEQPVASRFSSWLGWVAVPIFVVGMLWIAVQVRPSILLFTYNPYALFSVVACVANAGLLLYQINARNKAPASYWYILFLATLTLWSGAEALQRFSFTAEGALFWSTLASVGWIPLPVTLFIFTLSYARKEHWLRNPHVYLFLSISTLAFLYLNLTTDAFIPFTQDQLDLKVWGFNSGVERYFPLFFVWFEALYGISVYLIYQHYKGLSRAAYRQQARFFVVALLIPMVGGTITDAILPIFNIDFFPATVTLTTVMAVLTSYAIVRYGLLSFNPATLAPTILETMDEAVLVVGPTYVVEYANTQATSLLAKGSGMVGIRLQELFPHNFPHVRTHIFELLAGQRFAHLNKVMVRTLSEKVLPVSLSAARVTDELGDVRGYVVTLTDITELETSLDALKDKVGEVRLQNHRLARLSKQLEREKASVTHQIEVRTRELNSSKAQLTASINSLEIGFVMLNAELEVVLMNGAVSKMLAKLQIKQKKTKVAEHNLYDIETKFAGTELATAAQRCISEGVGSELTNVAVDASYFHIYLTPITVDNSVIGAVMLVQDITEVKAQERSKEEFFSIASHELRTPLTAIMGYTALIKSLYTDQMSDERLSKMVEGIEEGSDRMLHIVKDFLHMSRLEQGRLTIEPSAINVGTLFDEVRSELRPLLEEKGLQVGVRTVKNLPEVWADPSLLKQVLINLVGNAIKFTESGTIAFSAECNGDQVLLRVKDSGRGIALQNQSLLFRKFQQAGSSLIARESSNGTGLGLYISKLMVESMGGHIELEESIPGKGSTFALSLPLARNHVVPLLP